MQVCADPDKDFWGLPPRTAVCPSVRSTEGEQAICRETADGGLSQINVSEEANNLQITVFFIGD
jgi:hypothetical protein